jgi:hypothetical protein
MSRRKAITIPTPRPDVFALMETSNALKEQVENMAGYRGENYDLHMSFRDLLTLGIMVMDENGTARQIQGSDLSKLTLVNRNSDRN